MHFTRESKALKTGVWLTDVEVVEFKETGGYGEQCKKGTAEIFTRASLSFC